MKNLLTILAIVALFGCAQIPVKQEPVQPVQEKKVVPEDCVKSELDDYTYQGVIDPKFIHENWTEVPELRRGDYMLAELTYRNPDPNSDIPVALFLVQAGAFVAVTYLQNGEPRMYYYYGTTNCYQEEKLSKTQRDDFKKMLLRAMTGEGV